MTAAPSYTPVAILGAGLTGMSAALTLQDHAQPHRIFERLAQPGGHAITVEEQGFRFDRTGHLLHLRDAALRARLDRWIGTDALDIERRSMVWSHGVYTHYPFQANTLGLPPSVAYECVFEFLRAKAAQASAAAPRNFAEYCLQHFGEGFSRHFMLPYNSRLWGVPPSEITAEWCERFVPRPSVEDVIAGAVGHKTRQLGYNTHFRYPRLGIGQLSRALHAELPHIELNRAPRAIDPRARVLEFADERVAYDRLLNTAPLSVLLKLLTNKPPEIEAAARKLRCTHLYYLDVAVREPARKPYHWVYVPEARYAFYRVGCYSNFSAAMAPPGKCSFYVELASREAPDLETLLPQVLSQLSELDLIAGPDSLEFARLRRIDHAYVIFDEHYASALRTILPFLTNAGIISAGRYGGWNYSSMEDALIFGRDAAQSLLHGGPNPEATPS